MQAAVTPRLITFDTEEQLHEHAERLNEIGVTPDVPIMDAKGNAVLASRTAPGGDGWGFAYYSPGEDGFMHPVGCCECDNEHTDWKPTFPVTGLTGYDLS